MVTKAVQMNEENLTGDIMHNVANGLKGGLIYL